MNGPSSAKSSAEEVCRRRPSEIACGIEPEEMIEAAENDKKKIRRGGRGGRGGGGL